MSAIRGLTFLKDVSNYNKSLNITTDKLLFCAYSLNH